VLQTQDRTISARRRLIDIAAFSADLLVAALAIAGMMSLILGGYRLRLFGIRISVMSAWRPWIFGAVLLGIRAWVHPHVAWLIFLGRRVTRAYTGCRSFVSDRSRLLKLGVVVCDVLVLGLLVAGAWCAHVGAYRFAILGIRVSVASAWRPWLLGAVVLAVRVAAYPHLPSLTGLRERLRRPLLPDDAALFEPPSLRTPTRRAIEWALVVLGFTALTVAFTWPQVRRMDSVPDLGDPLFSVWRLAWVNHQIFRSPLTVFDANIFYPERLTLTYSDPILVPALATAPLFWLGLHQVLIYNLLFLSTFVFSGAAMYLLVRSLTGRRDAAVVAGVIFLLFPFRFEHYSHLELQMSMWMPLALWALHRTIARARWRDGLLTGLAFAMQMLSSLYFGLYLAVVLLVFGFALWAARGFPWRPLVRLGAGGLVAALLVAPVIVAFLGSRPVMGNREEGTVEFYSAEGSDYLTAHFRSRTYERWSHGGHPERQLFPRITPVALALVGMWPPMSAAQIGYALALATTFDGSLGLHGMTFPWLRDHVLGFDGLRVPARFGMLVGLILSILSGYGAARIFKRWPRARGIAVTTIVSAILVEAIPFIPLQRVWREAPAVYGTLLDGPPKVLAEFPIPSITRRVYSDTWFLYFSTFHWQTLVNGNSGFFPPSYLELLDRESDFPLGDTVAYLRERGVQYVTVHGAFMDSERFQVTTETLSATPGVRLLATALWGGAESRLYELGNP
jgi:hypothetical protein